MSDDPAPLPECRVCRGEGVWHHHEDGEDYSCECTVARAERIADGTHPARAVHMSEPRPETCDRCEHIYRGEYYDHCTHPAGERLSSYSRVVDGTDDPPTWCPLPIVTTPREPPTP